MKFLHSIRFKLTVLFFGISGIFFVASIYSSLTLNQLTRSTEEIFLRQTPIVRSIQQALVSLEEASSALGTGLVIPTFDRISDVRDAEAEFNTASLHFSMYTNALIWGSQSEAFKKVSGGILYSEWQKQGLDTSFIVPKVENEQSQLIGQVDIFFDSFNQKSADAFALKKKLLRISQEGEHEQQEKQTSEIKLDVTMDEVKTSKQKLGTLMKSMIAASDKTADEQIRTQQALMSSLQFVNRVVPIFAFIIAIVFGSGASYFFLIVPIQKLSKTAQLIANGELTTRAEIYSQDEIGQLAHSFNLMTETLVQRTLQVVKEQVKLQASIDSFSLGFIMIDNNNNLIKLNGAGKQILCEGEEHIETITCDMPYIINKLGKSFDLLPNLEKCKKEKTLIDVKDVPFGVNFLHIFIAPIIEKQTVIGCVLLLEDITEQKVLERSKDEFFSIASHELRTPLTSIRGNSSMMKTVYGEKVNDKDFSEMVDDIHESSVRLIGIVNDFLDVSRLEQGKMEFKKELFDLRDLILKVNKELEVNAKERHLVLSLESEETPYTVFADRNKMKEVLINLIGNSIKFTDEGGVTVSLSRENTVVKVRVSDTGRGISEENQKLLFRKFQQAGSSLLTRDTTKGTGLGLYISRLIIESLGGSIQLEHSLEGEGTTFSFTLPSTNNISEASEPSKLITDINTGFTTKSS